MGKVGTKPYVRKREGRANGSEMIATWPVLRAQGDYQQSRAVPALLGRVVLSPVPLLPLFAGDHCILLRPDGAWPTTREPLHLVPLISHDHEEAGLPESETIVRRRSTLDPADSGLALFLPPYPDAGARIPFVIAVLAAFLRHLHEHWGWPGDDAMPPHYARKIF